MRALAALAVALVLVGPGPAWADAGPSRDGIRVEVAADPGGASGLIRGSVEIDAPPEAVWKVVVDCDLAPRMVKRLKSCRILEHDPAGRWDVREHVSRAGILPAVRSVFRSEYDPPHRIRFYREGGQLQVLNGEWRLVPPLSSRAVALRPWKQVLALGSTSPAGGKSGAAKPPSPGTPSC